MDWDNKWIQFAAVMIPLLIATYFLGKHANKKKNKEDSDE